MSGLIRSSLLLTLARAIGVSVQTITIFWLAHQLPLQDMGYFGVAYAALGLIRYLGPLGTDQITLKLIARSPLSGEVQAASGSSFWITSAVGAILLIGFVAVASSRVSVGVTIATAAAIPAFALMGCFIGQVRGFGRNLSAQLPEAIGTHALFGGLLVLSGPFGAERIEVVMTCLALSGWIVSGIYVAIRLQTGPLQIAPATGRIILMLRDGFGMFQPLLLTAVAYRAPLFISALALGPHAAAVVEIASRIGRASDIVTNSVGLTISPRFARLHHQGEFDQTRRIWGKGALGAMVPAAAWLAALLVWGQTGLELFLPAAYADAYTPMALFAGATLANATFGLASNLMLMSGRERTVRLFSSLQLLAICVGSAALVPTWGMVGIGIAALLGSVTRDFGMTMFLLNSDWKRQA